MCLQTEFVPCFVAMRGVRNRRPNPEAPQSGHCWGSFFSRLTLPPVVAPALPGLRSGTAASESRSRTGLRSLGERWDSAQGCKLHLPGGVQKPPAQYGVRSGSAPLEKPPRCWGSRRADAPIAPWGLTRCREAAEDGGRDLEHLLHPSSA